MIWSKKDYPKKVKKMKYKCEMQNEFYLNERVHNWI